VTRPAQRMKAHTSTKIVTAAKKISRAKFKCRVCGGGKFYTDPANPAVRCCIPCENAMEERLKAKRARWEKKRPTRKRAQQGYRACPICGKEHRRIKYCSVACMMIGDSLRDRRAYFAARRVK